MKFILTTLLTVFTFSFGFSQCAVCTITNPATLPNPIGPGTVVCITSNQIYDGSVNLTGGSIHVCSGASMRINGSVDISAGSSMTVTGCSTIEVNGNIDNGNPNGLMVLDNCNCPAAIDVSGPIFGFPIVCGPLPVELISFDAKATANNVTLNWATATEINNDYFTIERSSDAINWTLVKTIDGAGNSNEVKTYTTSELVHSTGVYYYRLKQVDYDGKITSFNPITVSIDNLLQAISIKVYPNPAADVLLLDVPAGYDSDFTFEIVDLSGQVRMSKNIPSNESGARQLDISTINNGIFIVKISNNDFQQSSKLIVNR